MAPKHSQKIGNNYVLWFESSNSYVVISTTAYLFLNSYFESENKEAFIQHLQDHFKIPAQQAIDYYSDLSKFLKDITSGAEPEEFPPIPKSIPNTDISKYYIFGDARICINFTSEKLVTLIHPYLQHASVQDCSNINVVFDIFSKNELLYLFKNKSFIGSYEVANFHFLQGKFAMELVSSIYNNVESDWMATFHASTICNDKEAVMIIGDSGNGKSTLSALLMANGFDLLADDFTPMLGQNRHLYRFPAAISIKEGAFSMIEALYDSFNQAELQVSSSKHTTVKYLPPSSPFKSSQKHFSCHKLVMVKYAKDASSELRECSSEKILKIFIPDSWISPQPEHSKSFLNWLKELTFYELTYSDNEFAIERFKELFEL